MNPSFIRHDKLIPGVKRNLKSLADSGYKIVYLSGRRVGMEHRTKEMLKKHDLPIGLLIFRPKGQDTKTFKETMISRIKEYNEVVAYIADEQRDREIASKTDVKLIKVRPNKGWSKEVEQQIKEVIQ